MMKKIYGMNVNTEKVFEDKDMDLTSFIYLDGELEKENGYDLCCIPDFGKFADKYKGKIEITEPCTTILQDGREMDCHMHLVWTGCYYTGLVFKTGDEAAEERAKEFAKEHSLWNKTDELPEKVTIERKQVFDYFQNLITDPNTWTGNEEQKKITGNMLCGALVFAELFGLIADYEVNYLEELEPGESVSDEVALAEGNKCINM